jgi:hypothetical protein
LLHGTEGIHDMIHRAENDTTRLQHFFLIPYSLTLLQICWTTVNAAGVKNQSQARFLGYAAFY